MLALIHWKICVGETSQVSFALFLLPGGLPRRFTAVIQAGGWPRRLPRPLRVVPK
jgi:hypothetical protein